MGKDDVRRALEAMDDEAIRARLVAGDFTDVEGFALDDNERQLVKDAAADYPDVAGFAFDTFMKRWPDVSIAEPVELKTGPMGGPNNYVAAIQYTQQ